MCKIYVAAFLLVACNLKLTAQFEDYRFKSWDQQKGLTAASCINVMQDRNGYIWLSTINGICRFNGINFSEIGKYNDTVSIDGEVRNVSQDKDGIYWIASYEKGLMNIDFSKARDKQIHAFRGRESPPLRSLRCMLDDKSGNIWLGTESEGLYRFNKKSAVFSRIKFNNPYAKFPESIRCIYQLDDKTLWVGIVNGIIYIDIPTGRITYPKTTYSNINTRYPPTVRAICKWTKDSFAVATDRGAYFYIPATRQFVPVEPLTDDEQFIAREYHDVIKYSDEELWFATIDRGICYVNCKKKTVGFSYQASFKDETVGRHPVYKFFKDAHENIWVCHNKGLSYLNIQNTKFKNLAFPFHVSQPLVKDFLVARDNHLAIIQPDSLYTWTRTDRSPKSYSLKYRGATIGGKKMFLHKKFGYVFINDKGIFYADTTTQRAIPIFLKSELPGSFGNLSNISQILTDTIDNVEHWWFTVNEDFLLYNYNWSAKTFAVYHLPDGDALKRKISFYFTRMLKDHNNGLWLATRNTGLYYLPERTKDEFMHFTQAEAPGYNIPGNYIDDIALDNENNIWGTIRGYGLAQFTLQNNRQLKWILYGKDRGLTYLNLSQVKIDRRGNLWLSSANGLYQFDRDKKWFSYFGQTNGIRNPVLTLGSATDSSGYMYFASTDHLLNFDPDRILVKDSISSLRLLAVSVNDRSIDLADKMVLNLEPIENTIRFEFDVLDFENPTGHYFFCKLIGYDQNWQLLQDVFQQTYKSLPGGKYTFKLKNVNANGSHSKEISLVVNVADFYYKTTLFRVGVLILAVLLIFIAVKMYINSQLQKQKISEEKKRVLADERMRIAAELHDDLGGELSAIGLLSELAQMSDSKNTQQQFQKISISSNALVHRMNEIVWALNVKNDTLQNLIFYLNRYCSRYLDDLGIRFQFLQPDLIANIEMDGIVRRNIYLLVKEVLNNVAKHAEATNVIIKVEVDSCLNITISDDGKGFKVEELSNNPGNGMANLQKRIQLLNGFQQIVNANGTTIRFSIPLP